MAHLIVVRCVLLHFDMIGDTYREYIQQANVDIFREMNIEPSALENGYVPVDIDVTPFDNSKTQKEGVARTYKGFDGYAPIMAYIGTEGYLVNTELRAGKQHCQKETPNFLIDSPANSNRTRAILPFIKTCYILFT